MIIRSTNPRSLGSWAPESICFRCAREISRSTEWTKHRAFSHSSQSRDAVVTTTLSRRAIFRKEYFVANGFLAKAQTKRTAETLSYADSPQSADEREEALPRSTSSNIIEDAQATTITARIAELPHRRRQRLRQDPTTSTSSTPAPIEPIIPPDASSQLTTISSALPLNSLRRVFTTYLSLSKPRLSFLIVLTTTTAYSLYPVPALLLPTTTISPSLSTLTLLFLTSGTALTCASANALNMLFEPRSDAKMSRTRNRPLVRGLISPRGALAFAVLTGGAGVVALYYGVNPTVAFLSALNIGLYAGVYTPLKRISVLNTWVGAIVGGIPPLMGWTAAAGQSASGSGGWQELLFDEGAVGGWLLAGLLFAWQFPHFNALSWTIREEYKHAGHRMLAWVNPRMNGRVAFRYAVLCFPICVGLWYVGITDQGFLVTSSVVNGWLVAEAWRFWRREGQRGSARGLFWASVWHLPVVMVLAMAHKKGLWEGVWKWVNGGEGDEENLEDEGIVTNDGGEEPSLVEKIPAR
ncbi:MAG: Protoheme IX farnesyltransferase, mitochondrial [Pycnora praestabilis]|nr:MAG: Protoheme IX farnesyltransferase, mitochondrial [Pycnora praestabilis]